MRRERWTFTRPAFAIDANGTGHAVYTAHTPERRYSLVAFAHDLPPEQRSDRVIAEAWDATFTLFDGTPDEHDIARLADNVPRQEAGRLTETELTLRAGPTARCACGSTWSARSRRGTSPSASGSTRSAT